MRHEDTIKKLHLELESAAKKTMLEGVKNKVLRPIADLYTAGLKEGVSKALCDAAREIGTKKSERTLTGGQIFGKLGRDTWNAVTSFEAPNIVKLQAQCRAERELALRKYRDVAPSAGDGELPANRVLSSHPDADDLPPLLDPETIARDLPWLLEGAPAAGDEPDGKDGRDEDPNEITIRLRPKDEREDGSAPEIDDLPWLKQGTNGEGTNEPAVSGNSGNRGTGAALRAMPIFRPADELNDEQKDFEPEEQSRGPHNPNAFLPLPPLVDPEQVPLFDVNGGMSMGQVVSYGEETQSIGTKVKEVVADYVIKPVGAAGAYVAQEYKEFAENYPKTAEALRYGVTVGVPTAVGGLTGGPVGAGIGLRAGLIAEASSRAVNHVAGDKIAAGVGVLTHAAALGVERAFPSITQDEARDFSVAVVGGGLLFMDARGTLKQGAAIAGKAGLKSHAAPAPSNPHDLDLLHFKADEVKSSKPLESVKHVASKDSVGPKYAPGLIDGTKTSVDNALNMAVDFLGKDYKDLGRGRFMSKDGTRQVRMGDSDILGQHGGGKHMNFEILQPHPTKTSKSVIIKNIHIYIEE